MSPALAASRVLVCVLAASFAAAPARAQTPTAPISVAARRAVAVVNLDLAGNRLPIELAKQLGAILERHPELRPVADPSAAVALYDPIIDPDEPILVRARAAAQRATEELGNFAYESAAQRAREGADELLAATPSLVAKDYAELAFLRGKALLANGKSADARLALAHSQRLDPGRILDPARETPDVISAFVAATAAATAGSAPKGSINVAGDGSVWIDGAEVGTAPAQFTATVGLHTVWLTGVDRETRGLEIEVKAGASTDAAIPMVAASARVQVERVRQQLSRAPDSSARSAAMKRLATLVDVDDALLVSVVNDNVVVQSWRAGDVERPGFSSLSERGKRLPAELLEVLAPPRPLPEEPGVKFPIPFDKPSWIRSTQAKVVLGVTGVAVIGVGIYLLSNALRPKEFPGITDVSLGSGDQARQ